AEFTAGDRGALRRAVLQPVGVEYGTGFSRDEQAGGDDWHWALPRAQLVLDNPASTTQVVGVTATLGAQPGTVDVRGPGYAQTLPVEPAGTLWQAVLRLRPGRNVVTFNAKVPRTPAPSDPRYLALEVFNLTARAPALHDALCRLETGPARPADCSAQS
ncbi:MAG: hypothetical protein JOZ99_02780, partial [Actinobacteria bacterium]|nr:hypothetical protein [Actinomycetota bacterium]